MLTEEWRAAGRFAPSTGAWMARPDPAFSRALAARGLIGLTWPAPFGLGFSNLHRLAVVEELLRAGAPIAGHWFGECRIAPALLRHGSPDLCAEILPGIASADHVFCPGLTQPDAPAVHMSATPTAGGFRVAGRMISTGWAAEATHAHVVARTETAGSAGPHGLTEFVVETTAPDVSVRPITDAAGEHDLSEVMLDDVVVPARRVIGTVGNAWRQVCERLAFERCEPERALSAYPLFTAVLAAVSEQRRPGHAGAVGALVAHLATLRGLCRDIAVELDAGVAPMHQAATCSLLAVEFERDLRELADRVLDGHAPRHALVSAPLASPGSLLPTPSEMLQLLVAEPEMAP